MRRAPAALLAAALAVTLILVALARSTPGTPSHGTDSPARTAARQFYLRGLAAQDSMQTAASHAWMIKALLADPGYLPALPAISLEPPALPPDLAERVLALDRGIADPELAACIRSRLRAIRGELAGTPASSNDCVRYMLLDGAESAESPQDLPMARDLARRYPESPHLRVMYWSKLERTGAWAELLEDARLARRPGAPRALAGVAGLTEAMALDALGRQEEAARVEADCAVRSRSWVPEARTRYFATLVQYGEALAQAGVKDSARIRLARQNTTAAADSLYAIQRRGDESSVRYGEVSRLRNLLDVGALQQSVALADTLLARRRATDPVVFEAWVRTLRGRALVKLGRPGEAEPDLLRARALLAGSPWRYYVIETEHNLFHLYEGMGRDAEARRAGRTFVEMSRAHGRRATQMIALRDLGLYLQQRGEIAAAHPLFRSMVELIDSMGQLNYYAGEYYELVGDLDRAERQYRLGTRSASEDQGRAYSGLVRVAQERGDMAEAERYARAYDRGEGLRFPEATPLLPAVMAAEGRFQEAARALEPALAEAGRRGGTASWSALALQLAELEARAGSYAAAAALADSAAAVARRVSLPATEAGARSVAALARLKAGGAPRVQIPLLAAAAAAPAGRPLERLDRQRLLGDGLRFARDLPAALAAYGRAADIVDSIAPSLVDPIERAQFRGRQLANTSAALAAILEAPARTGAADRFASWSARRKARVLIEAGLQPARWRHPPRLRLGDLVARLAPDEAVIDYAVLDSTVAALVVTRAGTRLVRLPTTPDSLSAEVRRLRRPLEARIGTRLDTARARYPMDVAARLYDRLLRPLEPALGGRRRLTVVGDGVIHLVPFVALVPVPPGSGGGPRFVLDDYVVTTVPSLSAAPGRTRLPPGTALLVTDPDLPGAAAELSAVRAALGSRRTLVLTGSAASADSLRRWAAGAALLHLAVHATANRMQPGYAWLLLPGGPPSARRLYAYELAQLRMRGSLVVLSGCETGDGSLVDGEGLLSLGRSFLAAGADAAVATSWPVGSAAADLMATFYAALARGQPPSDALRDAQLRLRRDPRHTPLEWAPFILLSGRR